MKEYINFQKVNCKDCYKCLRACPVKSMKFTSHQAEIIEDECILCGNCFLTCPQKAKEIRNDVATVKSFLKSDKEVYVSLAPSFIANYHGVSLQSMEKALKKLGFKGVEETARGAEIVTSEYERILKEDKPNILISTCCPTVNLLIRKYYPEAVKYMAPVVTPLVAHSQKLKKEHKNACIVFIGPCLSKKEEVDENITTVDAALTFKELTAWLNEENITLEKDSLDDKKYKTRLYPIPSGIIKTMKPEEKYDYVSIDGVENCKQALEEILNGNLKNCFIEMSACVNSCIGGPGMDEHNTNHIHNYMKVINFSGEEKYGEKIANPSAVYKETPVKKENIPSSMIAILLAKLGKNDISDELNCGSCGYNTCKEKAQAMYMGKTEPSMCLPYLKNKAESYMDDIIANTPNGIIVLNDDLEVEMINKSACRIIKIDSPADVLNHPVVRVLNPAPYMKVLTTKENLMNDISYLSEYNKYVEQNIIYDHHYKVLMVIIRDITADVLEKKQKEEISRNTIEVTDKVIEKQMRAVQEIASLLGETTAETKVALEKLKDVLK